MPERVTKEERLVSRALEKARKVKELMNRENDTNITEKVIEIEIVENKKKEGYGLAGEITKASREFEIINKYIMFLNNTSGDEFIEAVFGEPYSKMENHRKDYVKKFMNERNSTRLWGMLDNDKRQALIDAAMKKYK